MNTIAETSRSRTSLLVAGMLAGILMLGCTRQAVSADLPMDDPAALQVANEELDAANQQLLAEIADLKATIDGLSSENAMLKVNGADVDGGAADLIAGNGELQAKIKAAREAAARLQAELPRRDAAIREKIAAFDKTAGELTRVNAPAARWAEAYATLRDEFVAIANDDQQLAVQAHALTAGNAELLTSLAEFQQWLSDANVELAQLRDGAAYFPQERDAAWNAGYQGGYQEGWADGRSQAGVVYVAPPPPAAIIVPAPPVRMFVVRLQFRDYDKYRDWRNYRDWDRDHKGRDSDRDHKDRDWDRDHKDAGRRDDGRDQRDNRDVRSAPLPKAGSADDVRRQIRDRIDQQRVQAEQRVTDTRLRTDRPTSPTARTETRTEPRTETRATLPRTETRTTPAISPVAPATPARSTADDIRQQIRDRIDQQRKDAEQRVQPRQTSPGLTAPRQTIQPRTETRITPRTETRTAPTPTIQPRTETRVAPAITPVSPAAPVRSTADDIRQQIRDRVEQQRKAAEQRTQPRSASPTIRTAPTSIAAPKAATPSAAVPVSPTPSLADRIRSQVRDRIEQPGPTVTPQAPRSPQPAPSRIEAPKPTAPTIESRRPAEPPKVESRKSEPSKASRADDIRNQTRQKIEDARQKSEERSAKRGEKK